MLQPLHPKFVHFPIALYLTGILAVGIYLWRKERRFEQFATFLLVLGWVGNWAAVVTGLVETGGLAPDDPRWSTLNQHITLGFALLVAFGLALYQRLRWPRLLDEPQHRLVFLALLALGAVLVVWDGLLGGKLVYELRLGVQP
jgi:uncharacterized membrane protein